MPCSESHSLSHHGSTSTSLQLLKITPKCPTCIFHRRQCILAKRKDTMKAAYVCYFTSHRQFTAHRSDFKLDFWRDLPQGKLNNQNFEANQLCRLGKKCLASVHTTCNRSWLTLKHTHSLRGCMRKKRQRRSSPAQWSQSSNKASCKPSNVQTPFKLLFHISCM